MCIIICMYCVITIIVCSCCSNATLYMCLTLFLFSVLSLSQEIAGVPLKPIRAQDLVRISKPTDVESHVPQQSSSTGISLISSDMWFCMLLSVHMLYITNN